MKIMKLFKSTNPQKLNFSYTLTTTEWNLCQSFAKATAKKSLNLYLKRGAPSLEKIIQDISMGKGAEVASYHILNPIAYNLSTPHFNILPPNSKSYEPDLTCTETRSLWLPTHGPKSIRSTIFNLHVKSTIHKASPSWLFSINDPLVSKETYEQSSYPCEDVVLLLISSPPQPTWFKDHGPKSIWVKTHGLRTINPTYTLRWAINLKWIRDYKKWRLPIKNSLKKTKVALYESDLLNHMDDIHDS